MRIISKNRDFYDTAGYIDQTVVFVRSKTESEADISNFYSYRVENTGLLGFCGKFYPYIHSSYRAFTDEKTGKFYPVEHFYFYSYGDYKNSDFYRDEKKSSTKWRGKSYKSRADEDYVNYFNHWKNSDKLFIELDAPYFKIKTFNDTYRHDKGVAIINPSLIDMQFGKVMDAPTVFQTVQFYLTNQLVKTKETLEIEDKYRIAQHGFDETSFRHPIKLKDLK